MDCQEPHAPDAPQYILLIIGKVTIVSLKTVKTVVGLSKLELRENIGIS